MIIIIFLIFAIIDYFIIKFEIKQNINLFYALHREEVSKLLDKEFMKYVKEKNKDGHIKSVARKKTKRIKEEVK